MSAPKKPGTEDAQLLAIFRKEAEELAGAAERALVELEKNPGNAGAAKTFFRVLHSMKGNAACVARTDLERYVHDLESALEPLREGRKMVEGKLLNAVFAVLYGVRDSALEERALPGREKIEELRVLADEAPSAALASERRHYRLTLEYPGEAVPASMDPPLVLADLGDLGSVRGVRLDPSSILPLDRLENPDALYYRYEADIESTKSIDDVRAGCFVFDEAVKVHIEPVQKTAEEDPGNGSGDEASKVGMIRIEAHKIDGLLNLAGELSIANARLRQLVTTGAQKTNVLEVVGELDRHFQFLQEQVLGTRMMAIDALFRPYVRLVRELSVRLGKRVRLLTSGDEVEMDKTIVEQMREPLMHMVRNALDHGIETPEERAAAGKDPEGLIQLRAVQREGSIYIEVHDDGRGLNRAKLRQRALEKGLVAEGVQLGDQQADELIFESGLSTAARVTNVSGRGVGMDIVRKSIEQVRGEVRVQNRPGRGCSFYIRLPLTLALLDGVVLRSGERRLVVPLLSVEEAVHVPRGALRRMAGQGAFLDLRGSPLPMILADSAAGGDGGLSGASGICVVLRFEDKRAGILIDEVVDQQSFVIKSLDENYKRVEGFTGATVMGDGRVALILDVPTLVRSVSGARIESEFRQ